MRSRCFSWDDAKARSNESKHGISFGEASTVFEDPLAVTIEDPDHSDDEERELTIGLSAGQQLLVVASAVDDQRIRIISARCATPAEKRRYMEEDIDRVHDKDEDDLRPEYDFSGGVRGKYYAGREVVWVRLDEELAQHFPTPDSVTEALRSIIEQREAAKKR